VSKVAASAEPIWPAVLIVFALNITAVWFGLLGFGLIQLMDYLL
jgi:hypothetical protein